MKPGGRALQPRHRAGHRHAPGAPAGKTGGGRRRDRRTAPATLMRLLQRAAKPCGEPLASRAQRTRGRAPCQPGVSDVSNWGSIPHAGLRRCRAGVPRAGRSGVGVPGSRSFAGADLSCGGSTGERQLAIPIYTMRQLLEAGVHFGHHTRRWNPEMAPYIFGVRNGVHIIDLEQTVPMLHRALQAMRDVAAGGRPRALRRHQAPGAGADRRGGQALRPVLRQSPLARRHAHQLQDHLAVDQAAARGRRARQPAGRRA